MNRLVQDNDVSIDLALIHWDYSTIIDESNNCYFLAQVFFFTNDEVV